MPRRILYEDILELSGGFGRYQRFIYFWYVMCQFPACCSLAFMVFGGVFPTVISHNRTLASLANHSRCDVILSDKRECHDYEFKSIVHEWDLTGDRRHIHFMITALQTVGMFFGPIFFGKLADAYGRRLICLLTILGLAVSDVVCGFSVNWQMFSVLRFMSGAFIGGIFSSTFILFAESVVQRWRLLTYFVRPMLGYLYLALLVGVVTDHWRILLYLIHIPSLFSFVAGWLFIVESPKFLLEIGKREEALKSLRWMARWNRRSSMDLRLLASKYRAGSSQHEIWHLFCNAKTVKPTLAIGYSWLVTASVYYGLLFNLNDIADSVVLNFTIIMVIRLVVNSGMVLVNRYWKKFGRRAFHQLGMIGTAVCMLVMATFLSIPRLDHVNLSKIRIPALVGTGMSGMMWCVGDVYAAELFPTTVRSLGYGFLSTCSRIGTIVAPQICLLSLYRTSAPYVLFLTLLISNIIVAYWWLPETKGCPLPDFNDDDDDDSSSGEESLREKAVLISKIDKSMEQSSELLPF